MDDTNSQFDSVLQEHNYAACSNTQATINYSELCEKSTQEVSVSKHLPEGNVNYVTLEHTYNLGQSSHQSYNEDIYANNVQASPSPSQQAQCQLSVERIGVRQEHNYAYNLSCSQATINYAEIGEQSTQMVSLPNSTLPEYVKVEHNYALNISSPENVPHYDHIDTKDLSSSPTSSHLIETDNAIGRLKCCCSPIHAAHIFNIPEDNVPISNLQLPMYITCATTQFDNILRSCNRYAQNSIGDGNCYFRCISLQFFGIEDYHLPIRHTIVSFMAEHLGTFSQDISLNRYKLSVPQYLQHMFNGGQSVLSWATDIEIEATATLLQVPIYVLGQHGHYKSWQRFLPRFHLQQQSTVAITPYVTILNTGSHFMLVRPIHVECNCLCEPPILSLCSQEDIINIDVDSSELETTKPKKRKTCKPTSELDSNEYFTYIKSSETESVPKCVKPKVKSDPASTFLNAIREGPDKICDSCKKTYYPSSVKDYVLTETMATLLQNLKITSNTATICSRCYTSLKQNKLPPLCILNQLEVCDIPNELDSLNVAEQKMVSLAHVYLKMVILPYGQKAMNGQVINFPYDVQQQVSQFTQEGLVLVRVSGQKEGTIPKEYIVDTSKIRSALTWLKLHNDLYKQITIPTFEERHKYPSIISISSTAEELESKQTGQNEGCLQESSITHKDPVLPKIDYKQFVDDINVPKHVIGRNTSAPINMFSEAHLEEMAFPTLFPDGKNGLRTPRRQRLTVLQYFQSRLLSSDNRWQSNLPYLFWATSMTEKEKLSEGINIAARIRSSKTNKRANHLTAGVVKENFKNNPDYPEHFYGFMKNIRGSAAYWNAAQLDLLSMISAKGPMTFFLTLSANDMNWDDLMEVLLRQNGKPCTPLAISKLSRQEKRNLMAANPVTTARHFCRRVHHIIHSYILSEEKPLGQIIDYFWRIEFQMRGSPHLHSLWWVQDAPDLDTAEGRANAPAFIDKYISTEIPDDPFMKKRVEALQRHSHTYTCKKYEKQGNACRFGFPHSISAQTRMKDVEKMRSSPHCYVIKRHPGSEYINAYNQSMECKYGYTVGWWSSGNCKVCMFIYLQGRK